MYKNVYFLVLFLLSSLAIFTEDRSRFRTANKLYQMVDNLPNKKIDILTRIFLFGIQPIVLPIACFLNGRTEIFERASCQRDFNNFLYRATESLTEDEKYAVIRNFVDRYESCEQYVEKNK
ncbi:MAG: hypothetical protein ACXWL2_04855 [Candidatus Chromulinivorax sp.]